MKSRAYYRVRSVVRFVFWSLVLAAAALLFAWLMHLVWVAIGVN
jgi:hypothetical protein